MWNLDSWCSSFLTSFSWRIGPLLFHFYSVIPSSFSGDLTVLLTPLTSWALFSTLIAAALGDNCNLEICVSCIYVYSPRSVVDWVLGTSEYKTFRRSLVPSTFRACHSDISIPFHRRIYHALPHLSDTSTRWYCLILDKECVGFLW